MEINEKVIQYLWKYRLLNPELITESGEPLIVLHPGEQNSDGGPDFFNARIRLGNTIWAGNVEIHVKASDWFRHNHQSDRAYDNTVLHVVYDADSNVAMLDGQLLPTLKVKGRFNPSFLNRYHQIMEAKEWIPCASHIRDLEGAGFNFWAAGLAIERLEQKSFTIKRLFQASRGDWLETYYIYLAICFGFKINALPFELLATSLPLKHLLSGCENLFRLEALLFGQAGMLTKHFTDNYPVKLSDEYEFLKAKYRITPISEGIWKFLRLRPANFPTIRISQFSRFIHSTRGDFFCLLENRPITELQDLFRITASAYWNNHFVFDKISPAQESKIIGPLSINLLIINAVVLFKFFYGLEMNIPSMRESALEMLEQLKSENNSEMDRWRSVGLTPQNALHSQALKHLKSAYCEKRRCLECRIGEKILRK